MFHAGNTAERSRVEIFAFFFFFVGKSMYKFTQLTNEKLETSESFVLIDSRGEERRELTAEIDNLRNAGHFIINATDFFFFFLRKEPRAPPEACF